MTTDDLISTALQPSKEPQPSKKSRRIPALVLSGFLGSGKTTVVQRILADAQQRGIRIALISNELGELGIDRALLGRGGQSYVELEGGCVCCELSDDLLETLTASDLKVDGADATGFEVIDGRAIAFDLPSMADGEHVATIGAGAMTDVRGRLVEAFSSRFTTPTNSRVIAPAAAYSHFRRPSRAFRQRSRPPSVPT